MMNVVNVVNVLFPPFSAMVLLEITDNFEIFPETPMYVFLRLGTAITF